MLHSFAPQLLVLDFDRDNHISSKENGTVFEIEKKNEVMIGSECGPRFLNSVLQRVFPIRVD